MKKISKYVALFLILSFPCQAQVISGGSPVNTVAFVCNPTAMTLPGTGGTYAAGDLVANSATAGSVVPISCIVSASAGPGSVVVTGATLSTSNTTITNGSFNVELYTSLPTVTNGNDGVFLSTLSGHFCTLPVSLLFVGSDAAQGRGAPAVTSSCNRVLSGTNTIYALISAQAAYAWTAGQTFTLQIEGMN